MSKRSVAGSRLEFIPPQVPTLVDKPPEGDEWIHEVKFDGYRVQVIVQDGMARIFTRNGHDWSAKFWPIGLAALALPCTSAIIDGEVIVCDEKGASDFNAVGRAIRSDPGSLCFVAFDLLHLDGTDLRAKPLVERRRRLADMVKGNAKIQFSEAFEGHAAAIFRAVEAMGLEGMVSKRADSRYRSGPSKVWLKTKCFVESDFELLGVVREPGQAPQALMATPDRKYVGSAIVALKGAMRDRLWDRVKTRPAPAPKGFRNPGAEWTQPGMVGRVRFLRGEGGLRHATLKEVRED
ncbi:RNA ligase family protein [Mesorhizobium sp. WSM2239]|uniref:RNA ligase family protein n=2 Tax=unclassified Mesorhizobium TaxID=325217 RepID=A0AAU8DGZ4_9HYPH